MGNDIVEFSEKRGCPIPFTLLMRNADGTVAAKREFVFRMQESDGRMFISVKNDGAPGKTECVS